MRRQTHIIIAASFAIAAIAAGCGKKINETQINGKPSEQFFSEMTYRQPNANDNGPSQFLAAADGSTTAVQDLGGGMHRYVGIAVFLRQDRTFGAVYDETIGCTAVKYKVQHIVMTSGRMWSVAGSQLMLQGIGTGDGFVSANVPSVMLRFDHDLVPGHGISGLRVLLQYRKMPQSFTDLANDNAMYSEDYALQMLNSSKVCRPQ